MKAERWGTFSLRDQYGHIAAELTRSRTAAGDEALRRALLERALELIDLTLADPRRREGALQFLTLRELVARAYVGETTALDLALAAL